MRMVAAVPEVPNTIIGMIMCRPKSPILARVQGAVTYSGENSPPTLKSNQANATYRSTNANRKSGTARPRKPRKVTT